MTGSGSELRTLSTVVAVLLAVPVLMMVVMPVLGLTGMGHVPFGDAGWRLLLPVVPAAVLGSVAYLLYTVGRGGQGGTDDVRETLRSAYARGELSDAEFEARRDRLDSVGDDDSTSGVSKGE